MAYRVDILERVCYNSLKIKKRRKALKSINELVELIFESTLIHGADKVTAAIKKLGICTKKHVKTSFTAEFDKLEKELSR
jgi:hypothetical protein